MSQTRSDPYRRWFTYEKDSHRKVVASLETVPPDRRESETYQKALMLMGHLIAARRIWLFRFGITRECPTEFFPTGVSLEALREDMATMESAWESFLAGLTDDAISRSFEYKSSDAGWFRNTVEDILAQLFGHSWYHRGQIATLVRASGGQPAITDLVYWSREPIAAP